MELMSTRLNGEYVSSKLFPETTTSKPNIKDSLSIPEIFPIFIIIIIWVDFLSKCIQAHKGFKGLIG